ncbi:MAG: orotate phosphoribosyltransferase [Firmicutes bacterium]|nr:orotate phosphoribosyltransferase [Bacillota bacterium]
MDTIHEKLVQWLFETGALKVSQADKPFWYTSGTIGPYYINTHFLYGNEEKANKLLEFINDSKDDIYAFPMELMKQLWENYCSDRIYKSLIDQMCMFIKENIDTNTIDYISGGERRDWFFSFLTAKLLDKPHLTIYKDLTIYEFYKNEVNLPDNLNSKNVLHIADLVTEGSSYERAWIPAIRDINGQIRWSAVVVDRRQGGKELLARYGINLYPMLEVGKETFRKALDIGLINVDQYNVINEFIDDPKGSMRNFLITHPEFIKNALNAGGKEAERAKLCIKNNIYGIYWQIKM